MSVKTVTAGGGDTSVPLDRLYRIVNILGKRDLRMFLPLFESDPADDEDVQDIGQRGHHFSAMNNVAFDADPFVQGEVLAYRLNGADEALDMADHDDFSFGADGTAPNEPLFSLVIAVKLDVVASRSVMHRYDPTALANEVEWRAFIDIAGLFGFILYDEVVGAGVGRRYSVALAADQWYIIIITYDGSRVNEGIRLFINGVRVDDANMGPGGYVAMHNMAVVTSIGYELDGLGGEHRFLNGDIALPAITARQLSDGGVAEGAPAAPFSDVARLTRLYHEVLGI